MSSSRYCGCSVAYSALCLIMRSRELHEIGYLSPSIPVKFTACLAATSGNSCLYRMPPLGFSLELDEGTTSCQCCTSCTGFQFSDVSTSNWRVLSSHHCLARHLRTRLTTYIWSRKGLDAGSAHLPTDHVLFHAHTTHSVTGFAVARPHVRATCQQTYATRTLPTQVSGVNLKRTGFLAGGAQCDIPLNCAIQIALLN